MKIRQLLRYWLMTTPVLFLIYEIVWLPIDSYDLIHAIYLPGWMECLTDLFICGLQCAAGIIWMAFYRHHVSGLHWGYMRSLVFLVLLLLLNIVVSIPLTMFEAHFYHAVVLSTKWDWQDYNINVLVLSFISSLLIVICLLVHFIGAYRQLAEDNEKRVKQEAETRIMALQSQINPHFLFNNLSVAAGLVTYAPQRAYEFINHMASVYRHTLTKREQIYTTIRDELSALDKYMKMMQIKHGDALCLQIKPELERSEAYILPGTLQLLVENAIKHNRMSVNEPLRVILSIEGEQLTVVNDFRPMHSSIHSLGIGQDNIKERYLALNMDQVSFSHEGDIYVVKIPLIKTLPL